MGQVAHYCRNSMKWRIGACCEKRSAGKTREGCEKIRMAVWRRHLLLPLRQEIEGYAVSRLSQDGASVDGRGVLSCIDASLPPRYVPFRRVERTGPLPH